MKAKQVTLPETTDGLLVMLVDAGEYGMTDEEIAAELLDVGSPEHDRAVEMFGLLHDRGLVVGFKAWGAYIYREVTQEGRDRVAELKAAEKPKWQQRALDWMKRHLDVLLWGIIASFVASVLYGILF